MFSYECGYCYYKQIGHNYIKITLIWFSELDMDCNEVHLVTQSFEHN